MPDSALSSGQVLQLVGDLNDVGDTIRNILNDPTIALSSGQNNVLSADLNSISNTAANLATWAATVIFADTDAAFTKISDATKTASAKVDALQKTVAKMSSIINIVADVVNLGVAFGTGNVASILTASTNLYTDASKA